MYARYSNSTGPYLGLLFLFKGGLMDCIVRVCKMNGKSIACQYAYIIALMSTLRTKRRDYTGRYALTDHPLVELWENARFHFNPVI